MVKLLQFLVVALGLAFFVALAVLSYYGSTLTPKQPSASGFVHFLFPDSISIFSFWLAVATIALGVAGYFQLDFLRRAETIAALSANAAKKSADVAEKSLVAANRPWIKVDIQVAGPITYNVNGANFTLRYILTNVGHSPATQVWVNPRLVFPIVSTEVDDHFNPRAEMLKDIAVMKQKGPSPFGFAIFPGDSIAQEVSVTMSHADIERATTLIKAIYPRVVGAVDYRMAFDNEAHDTGFIIEFRRNDAPREFTTARKLGPQAIWVEEGDVPASEVRIFRSIIDGGFAD